MCSSSLICRSSINRNIVECKVKLTPIIFVIPLVLIETLWNVKKRESELKSYPVRVLIETLWNVKSVLF